MYQLQDELFEQREASQTVIRSKQQMIAELLQKNAELSVQVSRYITALMSEPPVPDA